MPEPPAEVCNDPLAVLLQVRDGDELAIVLPRQDARSSVLIFHADAR